MNTEHSHYKLRRDDELIHIQQRPLCEILSFECRMSNVKSWMSNVKCVMSNVKRQISNVNFRDPSEEGFFRISELGTQDYKVKSAIFAVWVFLMNFCRLDILYDMFIKQDIFCTIWNCWICVINLYGKVMFNKFKLDIK